jgi:serine/threonine-protein kinase HipA
MGIDRLSVYHRAFLVGTLSRGETDRMVFDYSPAWLQRQDSFPVSRSLPLDGNYQHGSVDHAFFANLLPEAGVRETLCRHFGISVSNDFELLLRIGGDCAGALSLYAEDVTPAAGGSYRPLSLSVLEAALRTKLPAGRLLAEGLLRFSLAGAQDKWSAYLVGDELFLPEGGFPGSHILKFDSLRFKGTGWNEAFVSFLARKLGLPVVEIRPFRGYTLVRRYDREWNEAGLIERIHQEDFCQALGLPAGRKYETEGGPGLGQCIALLREASTKPAMDIMNLLRWQIANVILGNADGHAKNLSLLYDGKQCRLAPFYDLVCTGVYPEITRELAMAVGVERDPGQIRKRDWIAPAEGAGIRPGLVFRLLEDMISNLGAALAGWTAEFAATVGKDPVIDRVQSHIKKQLRRTKDLLA